MFCSYMMMMSEIEHDTITDETIAYFLSLVCYIMLKGNRYQHRDITLVGPGLASFAVPSFVIVVAGRRTLHREDSRGFPLMKLK